MFKQTQLVLFVSCSLMSCLQHATHFIGGKRKPYEFNSQIAFLHQGKIFRFPPVVPTPTQGFHIDAGSQHCWLRHGNIDWSHVFPGPRSRCTCQAVRGDCSSVPPAAPTFGQAPISQEYIWCVGDNHFGTCCAWTHSFPNDPVQTPSHLSLPPGWRPLSAVCEPEFRVHQPLLHTARQNLELFRTWFQGHYDMYLHNETLSMLDDALLLMQAAEHFLHLDPASAPQPASDVPDSTGGLASEPTAAPAVPHRQLPPTDPWG